MMKALRFFIPMVLGVSIIFPSISYSANSQFSSKQKVQNPPRNYQTYKAHHPQTLPKRTTARQPLTSSVTIVRQANHAQPQRGTVQPKRVIIKKKVAKKRAPKKVVKIKSVKKYRVRGKTYHILPSSHGYQEKGTASWYGKPFHGRKTANGETYNMYNMTAAHKSLPLNTVVKVKNLSNNKEITVKINDRGPFKDHRIIDLSYAAAKKLGMVHQGLAKVEVKAVS